ncbi:MAG TPA: hypothetical protein VHA12_00055 [Candidatus Nanoarchaeia archaeon]|nr:hypothetical protein [Candidatus Nanoarchaeia archaeon]
MIGYASYSINKVVRRSFGLEFRSDWKISKVNVNGEIELERAALPQIVARASLWLPKWLDNPEIAAHVSFNGRTVIASSDFEQEAQDYKRVYEKMRTGKVDLQMMSDDRFREYIIAHGKEFI